jgi:hypothetical protein
MTKPSTPVVLACVGLLAVFRHVAADEPHQAVSFPRFRMQEIETGLKIGYGVLLVDINGDGKLDIVVADATRVVWYENPTWKRRTIIEGLTKPDNVCIAAYDIDGDGQLDLALGADWKGVNPAVEGTIQWFQRGKSLDEPWTVHSIGAEPTAHRMRFADVLRTGKPQLIVAPLLGRNSTAKNNWMDSPVRILAYEIPKDPIHDRWVPQVIDESLHVLHNFSPVASLTGQGMDLLTASYEGVCRVARDPSGKWTQARLGEGNQSNPRSNRGASEVNMGTLKSGAPFIATIEPWHGNQVVVYTPPGKSSKELLQRHVIDEQLRWGHAVSCADLDNTGGDSLIVGVRDDLSQKAGERRGVRLYKSVNDAGTQWVRHVMEDGGVAVEDLAAADLNGDGRVDIVAVGRQTHNVRIYWNEGARGGR